MRKKQDIKGPVGLKAVDNPQLSGYKLLDDQEPTSSSPHLRAKRSL